MPCAQWCELTPSQMVLSFVLMQGSGFVSHDRLSPDAGPDMADRQSVESSLEHFPSTGGKETEVRRIWLWQWVEAFETGHRSRFWHDDSQGTAECSIVRLPMSTRPEDGCPGFGVPASWPEGRGGRIRVWWEVGTLRRVGMRSTPRSPRDCRTTSKLGWRDFQFVASGGSRISCCFRASKMTTSSG